MAIDLPQCDDNWLDARWRSGLRKKLLAWFSSNARQMPWRSDPTPYHVWVSEIMLQQTQVATVLPYYQRWMRSFPTVADLAAAEESDLLRHWEGLGYYRRVRSMHAAAQIIMSEHNGQFPLDFDAVLALPGVGRYTAGAVLSIAAGAKLPILEGNTQRVFSRWIGLRTAPTETVANKLLWDFAAKMLPPRQSGQFNQAAMELGALVCLPKNPRCEDCPVRQHCKAAELDLQTQIPGKIKSIKYQAKAEFALILDRKGTDATEYLLRPLPQGGRWAGLWDFPRCTDDSIESIHSATDWLQQQLGTAIASGVRLQTIRHAVTKYRISLHVHQAMFSQSKRANPSLPEPWQWVSLAQIRTLPMSVTGRKIADFLADQRQLVLPVS